MNLLVKKVDFPTGYLRLYFAMQFNFPKCICLINNVSVLNFQGIIILIYILKY